jgi:hypothetical protein
MSNNLTIDEFCAAEGFSVATYYKLRKRGLGPVVFVIPGTNLLRIAPEEVIAWRARMNALAQSAAARLEAERRREQAVAAGRLAAQSPLHVSRRPHEQPRRRLRRAS